MRPDVRRLLLAAVLVAVVGAACVELTGQRIAWYHDVARDELRLLLAYDGVHDDVKQENAVLGRGPTGKEQLENFVSAQNVMVFDWFFHLDRKRLTESLRAEESGPARRDFAELAQTVAVSTAGHYRDERGRIGALQHIVIPGARRFFVGLNAAIRESIVAEFGGKEGDASRTRQLLLDACETGHDFLALDGQAIVVTIPIDREEYRAAKRDYFGELLRDARSLRSDELGELADTVRALGGIVSSLATSWIEEPDRLRIVLGDRDRSNLLRVTLRDEYEPNLEADVARLVPAALDAAVLEAALGDAPPADTSPLADLLAFGPPELTAFALARAADDPNSPRAHAARGKLLAMANAWNAAGRLPAAPTTVPDGASHVELVARFVAAASIDAK